MALLSAAGREAIRTAAQDSLWALATAGPYVPELPAPAPEDEEEEGVRVMAVVYSHGPGQGPASERRGPEPAAATFVHLDGRGALADFLVTRLLGQRPSALPALKAAQDGERRALFEFMCRHSPHVVVLGASHMACRHLRETVYQTVFRITEEAPRSLPNGLNTIQVLPAPSAIMAADNVLPRTATDPPQPTPAPPVGAVRRRRRRAPVRSLCRRGGGDA